MATNGAFSIRFRGVRGQYPAPGKATMGVGGNTACVEIRAGYHLLVLDAGTGLIGLGNDLISSHFGPAAAEEAGKPIVATILLSHTHHDHIQGFPFFSPNFISTSRIYLFGPKLLDHDIEQVLRETMTPPYFPVDLHDLEGLRVTHTIRPGDIIVLNGRTDEPHVAHPPADKVEDAPDQLQVRIMKSFAHPKGGVFIFRIEWQGKSVVYASDTEHYHGTDTRLALFAQDADILIHDAQYTQQEYTGAPSPKQGYGHSTPEMAAALASAARVRRLYLFHHDPLHSDSVLRRMELKARKVFPETHLAREGEEVAV